MSHLPFCLDCHINEVKPGEVSCWDCLGEIKPPAELFTYWVYGDLSPTVVHVSQATIPFQVTNGNVVFTWKADRVISVTGLTYQVPGGGQSFQFQPINAVSGDTIQFTINGIMADAVKK